MCKYRAGFESFRILFRSVHETLRVMRIVKMPVCYTSACHAVCKHISTVRRRITTQVSAVAETCDADALRICSSFVDQVFYNGAVVFHFPVAEIAVHEINTLLSKMSGSTVIHSNLNQSFFCIPLVLTTK